MDDSCSNGRPGSESTTSSLNQIRRSFQKLIRGTRWRSYISIVPQVNKIDPRIGIGKPVSFDPFLDVKTKS